MTESVRVKGFLPSINGFHFNNKWTDDSIKDFTLSLPTEPPVDFSFGSAKNGLCGGMVFAVLDLFKAKLLPPADKDPPTPTSNPDLFNYIAARLVNSWAEDNVNMYLSWIQMGDGDSYIEIDFLGIDIKIADGISSHEINEEWPNIQADLRADTPSPIGLVAGHEAPFFGVIPAAITDLGNCHQVLAYGYDIDGTILTIYIYDPDAADQDDCTIVVDLSLAGGNAPLAVTNHGGEFRGFFHVEYEQHDPSTPASGAFAVTVVSSRGIGNGGPIPPFAPHIDLELSPVLFQLLLPQLLPQILPVPGPIPFQGLTIFVDAITAGQFQFVATGGLVGFILTVDIGLTDNPSSTAASQAVEPCILSVDLVFSVPAQTAGNAIVLGPPASQNPVFSGSGMLADILTSLASDSPDQIPALVQQILPSPNAPNPIPISLDPSLAAALGVPDGGIATQILVGAKGAAGKPVDTVVARLIFSDTITDTSFTAANFPVFRTTVTFGTQYDFALVVPAGVVIALDGNQAVTQNSGELPLPTHIISDFTYQAIKEASSTRTVLLGEAASLPPASTPALEDLTVTKFETSMMGDCSAGYHLRRAAMVTVYSTGTWVTINSRTVTQSDGSDITDQFSFIQSPSATDTQSEFEIQIQVVFIGASEPAETCYLTIATDVGVRRVSLGAIPPPPSAEADENAHSIGLELCMQATQSWSTGLFEVPWLVDPFNPNQQVILPVVEGQTLWTLLVSDETPGMNLQLEVADGTMLGRAMVMADGIAVLTALVSGIDTGGAIRLRNLDAETTRAKGSIAVQRQHLVSIGSIETGRPVESISTFYSEFGQVVQVMHADGASVVSLKSPTRPVLMEPADVLGRARAAALRRTARAAAQEIRLGPDHVAAVEAHSIRLHDGRGGEIAHHGLKADDHVVAVRNGPRGSMPYVRHADGRGALLQLFDGRLVKAAEYPADPWFLFSARFGDHVVVANRRGHLRVLRVLGRRAEQFRRA
jgi:hypothetical protein